MSIQDEVEETIEKKLAFTNGWRISDSDYSELCKDASQEIHALYEAHFNELLSGYVVDDDGDCEQCMGTGSVPENGANCPKCNGTGKITRDAKLEDVGRKSLRLK